MISFRIHRITLEIIDGDIAAQDVDAVVIPANSHFSMDAGAAGALKARGGASIEAEAMSQGPVDPGECVITGGGHLPARHVIHAAAMDQDLQTSAAFILRTTRNALALAEESQLASIAFPAFGTGAGGFPIRGSARIMIDVVRAHHAWSLRTVRFVLFGQPAYRAFTEVAGEQLGAPLDGPPDCPLSS